MALCATAGLTGPWTPASPLWLHCFCHYLNKTHIFYFDDQCKPLSFLQDNEESPIILGWKESTRHLLAWHSPRSNLIPYTIASKISTKMFLWSPFTAAIQTFQPFKSPTSYFWSTFGNLLPSQTIQPTVWPWSTDTLFPKVLESAWTTNFLSIFLSSSLWSSKPCFILKTPQKWCSWATK